MLQKTVMVPTTDNCLVPVDIYVPETCRFVDPDVRRPAIVVVPGGGYSHHGEREMETIALRFMAHGFNAFVVRYRFAPHRFPAPQQDAAAAMAYVRANAAELHTNPDRIALVGFSAGGHLAGFLGVQWQNAKLWEPLGLTPEQVKPNALVLCYGVLSYGEFAENSSYEYLTGTTDPKVIEEVSVTKHVSEKCPPTFLWAPFDDTVVPVENTLEMAMALSKYKVHTEVHIFPEGLHGAALCNEQCAGVVNPQYDLPDLAHWPELAVKFLKKYM